MTNLISINEIKNTPAKIEFDFEAASAIVDAHLEKYRGTVLVEDTYKDGKELIKTINETRKALDTARKEQAKIASEPIREFESKMKGLISKHDALLDDLRAQIKRFEDERKALITSALNAYLVEQWDMQGVSAEFRKSVAPEPLLGDFTAGNALTKLAREKIELLASADKMLQMQTEHRLGGLELACIKAGLAAPLTQAHVQSFLFAPQDEYESRLNALMQGEIEREKRAVAAHEARIEQERLQKEKESVQVEEKKEPVQQVANVEQAASAGAQDAVITIRFTAKGAAHLADDALIDALDKKLKGAGFTTHEFLTVERI